jgi:hypothetical protein
MGLLFFENPKLSRQLALRWRLGRQPYTPSQLTVVFGRVPRSHRLKFVILVMPAFVV